MKRLLLLRHAKSGWDSALLSDHQRPLNERGRGDAHHVGPLIARLDPAPQFIACSTAIRCRETLERSGLLEGGLMDNEVTSVIYDDRLYHASPDTLATVIRELPEPATAALLIGHNPGLEAFASELAGEPVHLATATLVLFDLELDAWQEFNRTTPVSQFQVWRM